MVYITGDTHGSWQERFNLAAFPEQQGLTKDDYVIVLGDFGLWEDSEGEAAQLDWLNERLFTTLFISGNHDNYDMLDRLPVEKWHGGKVNFIRSNIIHLRRGQVFEIEGEKFFTFGGASSHDIQDGIIDPNEPNFVQKKAILDVKPYPRYRINHVDWWPQELPSPDEIEEAVDTLEKNDNKVDYILTHCPYTEILKLYGAKGIFKPDMLTDFLQNAKEDIDYKHWMFGHLHIHEVYPSKKTTCMYRKIMRITDILQEYKNFSEEAL